MFIYFLTWNVLVFAKTLRQGLYMEKIKKIEWNNKKYYHSIINKGNAIYGLIKIQGYNAHQVKYIEMAITNNIYTCHLRKKLKTWCQIPTGIHGTICEIKTMWPIPKLVYTTHIWLNIKKVAITKIGL